MGGQLYAAEPETIETLLDISRPSGGYRLPPALWGEAGRSLHALP